MKPIQTLAAILSTSTVAMAMALPGVNDTIILSEEIRGDTLLLTYRFPHESIRESVPGYSRITLGKTLFLSQEGKPILPIVPIRLAVPAGYTAGQVEVISTVRDTVALPSLIEPAEPYITPDENGMFRSTARTFDPLIYSPDRPFYWPEHSVESAGVQFKTGNEIGSYRLYPVRFNARTRSAELLREITIRVVHQKKNSRNVDQITRRPLDSDALDLTVPARKALTSRSDSRGSAQYLVITSEALKNASGEFTFQALIAEHQKRGMNGTILTVEEIETAYQGGDRAEKIRNAVIDYYNTKGTEYLLLGGDTPIIPARSFYINEAPEGRKERIVSDSYYSCLDGTHNNDNDTIWGESTDGPNGGIPDQMAEVFVGRFPVETVEELANMVRKTLYQLRQGTPSKVLLAGEHLGFGGISEFAKPSMEEVWLGKGVPENSEDIYVTSSFAKESNIQRDTLYAESFPNQKWYGSDLVKKINTNGFGVINHLGHGLERLNMRLYLNTVDLDSIKNSVPFFVNSQACLSGSFQVECIAERLTAGHANAAWAGIWNSGNGLGQNNSTNSPSQWLQRQFWHGYFGKEMDQIGRMNAYADETAIEMSGYDWAFRWVAMATNLIGDPAATLELRNPTATLELKPIPNNPIWERGHNFTINWYDNFKEPVSFDLMKGDSIVMSIATNVPSSHTYDWKIPDTAPLGEGFRIRISCTERSVSALSDPFSIEPFSDITLTTPVKGDTLYKAGETTIRWSTTNITEPVHVILCYSGKPYDTIATNLPATQTSVDWTVPVDLQHDEAYSIRVVSSRKEWLLGTHAGYINIYGVTGSDYPNGMNFDSLEQGTSVGMWSQIISDDFNWKIHKGPTPSRVSPDDWWNVTGPMKDASGEGNYIYCEGTGNVGKQAGLFSQPYDISGLRDGKLSMKVHMYTKEDYGNMGTLSVYLLVDGVWNNGFTLTGSQGDSWIQKTIDLSRFKDAKTLLVYMQGQIGKSFASDIAIDEFMITGTKESVGILTPKTSGKLGNSGWDLYPTILETGNAKMTLTGVPADMNLRYTLYDVVGNPLVTADSHGDNATNRTITVPSTLGNGTYVLHVQGTNGTTRILEKFLIGKKAN